MPEDKWKEKITGDAQVLQSAEESADKNLQFLTLFTDIHKTGAVDNDQCYLLKETIHYSKGINAQSI